MPYQSDWILRQIEMMGVFFERVLAMILGKDYAGAQADIEETSLRQTGQKLDHLLLLEPDDLVALFGDDERGRGYAVSAVEVLCAQSALSRAELDEPRALLCARAALEIAVRVEPDDHEQTLGKQVARMRSLEASLGHILEGDLLERLYGWYVEAGRWAEAENLLEFYPDEAARAHASALYAGLEAKSDAEIEAGGLSRQEIAEGRVRFGV